MDEAQADLERRRAAGENVHRSEHISGMKLEPGYKRRAQNGRLIFRALSHGAWDPRLDDLERPPEMSSYS
jgi:hypothetical protein